MKIDATVADIRALLQLAELDGRPEGPTPEAYRRGRDAAQRRLPQLLVERYQSLVDAGRSRPVVAIERGACSGCHVRLPTMMEYQARRSPALHTCPHCQRLLYAPELVREDRQVTDEKVQRRGKPAPVRGQS